MNRESRLDLTRDLVLPTLMFMALGGMTWAVRGCSGFGASAGCIFAGVVWGAAWWYLAYEPKGEQTRRYSSGWIILAVTLAFGFSGARGWMQWPSFFDGHLDTNVEKGHWISISPSYGSLWLFIAGMPWAGLGACALAWCGSQRETRVWHWVLRMGCGAGVAYLAQYLYYKYPSYFLPMYDEFESSYKNLRANPNLRRLIGDCGLAIFHLGYYVGFLLYETIRRDWKNVTLIATVGILNGAGWAACQNWKWANRIWKSGDFNFWRCWESSGGISIGLALGIAYYLVNRPMSEKERALVATRQAVAGPNFEWFLIFCGLMSFFTVFLRAITANWGTYYLTLLYVFAAGYYLLFRRTPQDGRRGYWIISLAAVPLAALFIAVNYLPATVSIPDGHYLASLNPILKRYQEWTGHQLGRNPLYYNLAVLALGLTWYVLNRSRFDAEKIASTPMQGSPQLERFALYIGLLTGLGLSIRNGAKGWCNIYWGDERYWSAQLWKYLGPTFLICMGLIAVWTWWRSWRQGAVEVRFPHAYGALWMVLIIQNVIAQLITGPWSQWHEVAFSIYYLLLFFITAVIAVYYRTLKAISN